MLRSFIAALLLINVESAGSTPPSEITLITNENVVSFFRKNKQSDILISTSEKLAQCIDQEIDVAISRDYGQFLVKSITQSAFDNLKRKGQEKFVPDFEVHLKFYNLYQNSDNEEIHAAQKRITQSIDPIMICVFKSAES